MEEIEGLLAKEDFWNDPEKSKPILKERTALSGIIEKYNKLNNEFEDNQVLLDLAIEESDDAAIQEVSGQIPDLECRTR